MNKLILQISRNNVLTKQQYCISSSLICSVYNKKIASLPQQQQQVRYKSSKPQIVHTDKSPAAVGAYSQAITIDNMIYLSGSLGLDPQKGGLVDSNDVKKQAKQAMDNIGNVLTAAGSDFNHVVKTTILLSDINNFSSVNEIYASYFKGDHKPARACYAVKDLPLGALVEIEAIAVKAR